MPEAEKFFGFGGAIAGQAYYERLMKEAGMDVPAPKGAKALVQGCGEGHEALYLARRGWTVDAQDIQADKHWPGLAKQGRGRLRFKAADAQKAPGAPARYDLVMEKDMAHHASDPVAVFKSLARSAKPGGRVLIIEGNRLNPIFYVHLTLLGDHDHFSPWRLRRLLNAAGLQSAEVLKVEARVWPFNRDWAQRLFGALQDLAQAFPLWHPFVCYHICRWQKPAAGKAPGRHAPHAMRGIR